MRPIYFDAAEFIRKREFALNVPVFYHPHMSDAMINAAKQPRERVNPYRMVSTRQRNNQPFRHIPDPMQLQYACYSIEIMIDMCQKKVEFIILNDEDLPEILDGMDRYLVYLREDVECGNENVITYVRKVLKFREQVYKHYFRFMTLNPAALEGIYPNGNSQKNIFSLMNIGCRKENLLLDPLKARSFPPYDLADTLPKEKRTAESEDIIFESSLGISKGGAVRDDGKDFDLDGFLGIRR